MVRKIALGLFEPRDFVVQRNDTTRDVRCQRL